MTTIAWDGKTLAADRQMGGWMNVGKIFKLKDGRCVAGAVEIACRFDADSGKGIDVVRVVKPSAR